MDSLQHYSRHTLILTTWRSGSTFLGDLLNQYPGTFYYFEPLHYYANNINSGDKMSKADFLESLFRCKFDRRNFGYLEHVARWSNTFLFKNHNFRLWMPWTRRAYLRAPSGPATKSMKSIAQRCLTLDLMMWPRYLGPFEKSCVGV